jgi:hypothetical protein
MVAWVAEHVVVATILRLSREATERQLSLSQRQTATVGIVEGEKFWVHQPLCNFVARYDFDCVLSQNATH